MPATHAELGKFLNQDSAWSDSEKYVIMWQFQLLGDFQSALTQAIVRADEDNLKKLESGFPTQVHGFRQWAYGDLAVRLRKAGLDI